MTTAVIVLASLLGCALGMAFYFARRAVTADERAAIQVCLMGERYEKRVEALLDRLHAFIDGAPLDKYKRAIDIPRMVELDHDEKMASIEANAGKPEEPVYTEVGGDGR